MEEITKNWDEFWAQIIGIKVYDTREKAEKYAGFQVEHAIRTLTLVEGSSILDLACGAGFHAVSFAKRGMRVTGVDISQTLIEYANKYAKEMGLSVEFIREDMRNIDFDGIFDAVVIFNQSFGFFDDETNLSILKRIKRALKKQGKFYIQTLNPLFDGRWRNVSEWAKKDDGYWLLKVRYNPYTGRIEGEDDIYIKMEGIIIKKDKSEPVSIRSVRLYTLPELSKLVLAAGMEIENVYGAQKIPLKRYDFSSPDMIVIGRKK